MPKRVLALGAIVAIGLLVMTWWLFDSPSSVAATSIEEVGRELVAPCCWTQTVDVHDSQIAAQMRWDIGNMLAKGMSKDEIISFYTAKYGERILAKPPMIGFGMVAYALPVIFVVGGGSVIYFLFRHWINLRNFGASSAVPQASSSSNKAEAEMRERLRRELDRAE